MSQMHDAAAERPAGEVPGMTPGMSSAGPSGAVVRVLRGDPDALELAALIAGLTAASASATEVAARAASHRWMDRSHVLRGGSRLAPQRGRDAWRWSLHP